MLVKYQIFSWGKGLVCHMERDGWQNVSDLLSDLCILF
jgi:hypothetical protein